MAKRLFPRMYLSGFRAIMKEHGDRHKKFEFKWIERSKVKYRCFNFGYICKNAFYFQPRMRESYDAHVERNIGIFMDSGAFSFYQMYNKAHTGKVTSTKKQVDDKQFQKLRDQTIDLYEKFIKKEGSHWDFYANFDYVKDCDIIWEMQKALEKRGLRPAPVYHGDKSLDYFRRYCDKGYKIVCIGMYPRARPTWDKKRRWFEKLFSIAEPYGVKLHGLAVTNLSSMSDFPWYSADSATWAKVASYGGIVVPDPEKNIIKTIHVSDRASGNPSSYNRMGKEVRREIEELVESNGFDFQKVRTNLFERSTYNAYVYANLDTLIEMNTTKTDWERLIDVRENIL